MIRCEFLTHGPWLATPLPVRDQKGIEKEGRGSCKKQDEEEEEEENEEEEEQEEHERVGSR